MIPFILHIIRFLFLLFTQAFSEENMEANGKITSLIAEKDCVRAVIAFETLDSTGRVLPENRLKIMDCYYKLEDTASMKKQLGRLSGLNNPDVQATLLNQRALLKAYEGDTAGAINLYRSSIETKNHNTFAKRNLEYLSKVYQPNRNQSNQSPNTVNKQNEEQGGQVEQSNRKDDLLNKQNRQEINLSQAMQILDAMRSDQSGKILILPAHKNDTTFYGNQ